VVIGNGEGQLLEAGALLVGDRLRVEGGGTTEAGVDEDGEAELEEHDDGDTPRMRWHIRALLADGYPSRRRFTNVNLCMYGFLLGSVGLRAASMFR
jgi:hypothetical protein